MYIHLLPKKGNSDVQQMQQTNIKQAAEKKEAMITKR